PCPVTGEAPNVLIKAAELFLHFEKTPRVGDGAFDFQAIADDALIVHQARDIRVIKSGDLKRIKVLERLAKVIPLSQDGNPAQPRLEALQDQHLEYLSIVMDRKPPLRIVIFTVESILSAPPAPRLTLHLSTCIQRSLRFFREEIYSGCAAHSSKTVIHSASATR